MGYNKNTNMYEGYIYKIYNDVNDKVYIGQTTTTIKERWHGHMSSALNEKRYVSALYNAIRKYGRDNFHIVEIDKLEYSTKEELIKNLNLIEQQRIIEYKSLTCQNGYNFEKGGNNKCVPGRSVCKYDLELNYLDTYISLREASRLNNIDDSTIGAVCNHDYYTAGGYVWAYEGEHPVEPRYYDKSKAAIEINKKRWANHIKTKSLSATHEISEEEKQLKLYNKRLKKASKWWDGRKIYAYNSFEEIVSIYDNPVDAVDNLKMTMSELKRNLEGTNLSFEKLVLRYENEPFNTYPRSMFLQPVTLYDLQGNFVANFETKGEAENYMGALSGEVTKTLKRGGSCNGYLISEYGKPLERKLERCEKIVLMCDNNWEVLREFPTKHHVSIYFNMCDSHQGLNKAIKNKTKYKGYYWKIKEEFALTS